MRIGHIHFDTPGTGNRISEFLSPQDNSQTIIRNKYVKITNGKEKAFFGRIIEGPYFIPEEINRDSAFAQTTILKGDDFKVIPNYYAYGKIEILGESDQGKLIGTNSRPLPKSDVDDLSNKEVETLIGIKGDLLLGSLNGYEDVVVSFDSKSKKVLPRNIGIFGTVGSGKSNTAQVIMEECSQKNYSIVVLDVEGEYTDMDFPSTETNLLPKLTKINLKPEGIKDFKVFYPSNSDSPRKDAKEFDINFGKVDPYIISEMANLSEPQEGLFFKIIDKLQQKPEKNNKLKKESDAIEFLEGGEFQEGDYTIDDVHKKLLEEQEEAKSSRIPFSTFRALARQISSLDRTGIFDKEKGSLDIKDLITPGRVNIIDLSTIQNDGAKNIIIAWILKSIFDEKLKQGQDGSKNPVLIMVEEAHTFVSRDKVGKMSATMDMLKLIARRGRKRWLCLGFISQQPSHLPDEIFELCNTRIIHGIKSNFNLDPLKHTSGDIISEIWDQVPGLGQGQAVITSPQFNHTIMVNFRPSKSKRKLIE